PGHEIWTACRENYLVLTTLYLKALRRLHLMRRLPAPLSATAYK
ncbi:7845_t:CDS:1, partial [Acaulospora morrowiae]